MLLTSLTRRVSILAIFGLLPTAFASGQTTKQSEMEDEGMQLIGQLEDVSRDVHYHADRLSSFTGSALISKWTHYHHLMQIKELVNDGLRPALTRLTEIQSQLSTWHQNAIDQMLVAAKALAADTTSALLNQNDAKNLPIAMNAEYIELIAEINNHAEALVKTSDAAGDYAAAHRQAVEAGLKVPEH